MYPELSIEFEPRDLWVGAYVDDVKRAVYVCFVPCFPLVIRY